MSKSLALFCGVTFSGLLALTSVSQAASGPVTVALCPVDDDVHEDAHQLYYAADGSRQRLSVSTTDVGLPSCAATTLQVDGSIVWSAPAAPGPGDDSIRQLGLLGNFATGAPSVSEVIVIADPDREAATGTEPVPAPAAVSEAPPLALDQSVLPWLAPQTFGIDERVTTNGASLLRCEPGEHIAGALFSAGRPWAAGTGLQLEMRASGQGQFHVALGDAQRDILQTPLRLGELSLPTSASDGDAGVFRFDLPDNGLPWTSLTIICPPGQGELELLSLAISSPQGRQQPDQHRAQPSPSSTRGAWLWSPQLWQDPPDFIWQAQSQQQLTEIYISIPVDNTGQVANPGMLARFLTQAHDRELDVRVVIGDPRDVLPASLPALETRILAFLHYNRNAPASAQLSGVQLDIEPYLLRGFARAQPHWRERYLSVVRHVHNMLDGRMSLDLVMPAWWGSHPAWGEQLFSQLPVADMRLSIMNYHTSAERLRANAAPFLAWGQRASVPVLIALESGYLPDETLRNVEAGVRKLGTNFSFNANYYLMSYKNQLVLTGELNDVGANIRTNVADSYRMGIELEGAYRISNRLKWAGNFTFSQNKIAEFTEVIYDYGSGWDEFNVIEIQHENTDISFSPGVIVGSQLTFSPTKRVDIQLLSKYVGSQFLDNTSNQSRMIDAFFVNDMKLDVDIPWQAVKHMRLALMVNNVFNVMYQSNGYTFGYRGGGAEIRENYFYPQAGTNFLLALSVKF